MECDYYLYARALQFGNRERAELVKIEEAEIKLEMGDVKSVRESASAIGQVLSADERASKLHAGPGSRAKGLPQES